MKLGVLVEGQEGLTWDRWRHLCTTVEALGFESLWRSDHLLSLQDHERDSLECWVSLAIAAVETRRLRFGSLVTPITFRPPALLAKMAADVATLSGGRLVLGVGAGWNDLEHRTFGLAFPRTAERLDRLEEGLEIIVRLLRSGPVHFAGRYYQLEGADPRPKPGPVPILVAGGGERRTLSIAARFADEWDVPGGLSPEAWRAKSARLDEHCRAIGRDSREIVRCASTAYLVAHDERDLRRRSRALQDVVPRLASLDVDDVPAALRAENWRVGTPEQVTAAFRALADVGVERLILQHNDLDDFEALETVAREVLPAVAG